MLDFVADLLYAVKLHWKWILWWIIMIAAIILVLINNAGIMF